MSKFDYLSVEQLQGLSMNLYGKSLTTIPPIFTKAHLVALMEEFEEEFIHNLSAKSVPILDRRVR